MLSSACEARIWPIGEASGGQPASERILHDLGQRVEQPVAGRVRAEMDVERGDETGGKVVLGRAHGDARRDGRDRRVADVLVDDVRRLPQVRGRRRPSARPSPSSVSTSDSPETRCSVSASG